MDAAFSYEGSADEASFVVGPALVGLSVAVVSPAAALALAAGLLGVFGSWFALHETAELTRGDRGTSRQQRGLLVGGTLLFLAAAQFLVGAVFGSVQAATSVLATAAGEPGLTGLLHALLGVGSVLAGLLMTTLPTGLRHEHRLRLFAVGLMVLASPLLLVDGLGSLAVVLLFLGCTIAPYMITVFTLAERVVATGRAGAAMTVLAGSTGMGYAAGSGIAGRLADWGGHTPAFAVTAAAGVLATLLAFVLAPRLRLELQRADARRADLPLA